MFKNEVIDRYIYALYYAEFLLKNAQVCIYSLSDLNIGHCEELSFLEGKLGRFLKMKFFKNIAF